MPTQSHSLLVKCVTHGQGSLASISDEKWVPFSSFFNAGVRQIDIHVIPFASFFNAGVNQIDIHVNPSPSDIDERKSMFINGDAVAIVY